MSDEDSLMSSGDESQSTDFNPWLVGGSKSVTYLKKMKDLQHVPGQELDQVLPEEFDALIFEGHASRESKEYKRVLYLLQSGRRWRTMGLSDYGQGRATPEFLSLVVLALTKTDKVSISDCPIDENFFACLNSGMQTLTHVKMISSNITISHDAAAMFANGLVLSRCIERLEIQKECWFEPGAGLKLAEGIKQNKSLKDLTVDEYNLSTVAMISILRAVTEGCLPKLVTLDIALKHESDCTKFVTKMISSDTCHVEDLTIHGNRMSPNIFRKDAVQTGKANLNLKSLDLSFALLDASYLTMILPMMPTLSHLELSACEISDITRIVDHLCRPNTAIKSIDLHNNRIGIDQAEKFMASLADMQSVTDVNISSNRWDYRGFMSCDGKATEEQVQNILKKVSNCCNLECFDTFQLRMSEAQRLDLKLNLAINRAWRRELCYKNSSPPSKLFPLVIARALRKTTQHDLRADVVLALIRERMSDLVPLRND